MELFLFIGRVLFAFLFIGSGIAHLTQTKAMAPYAESRGIPSPVLAVQVSGAAMLLGGIAVVIGFWGDAASLGLAVLSLILAVGMHAFWKETDPQAKQMEMVAFNKDVALAGGAIALYVLFYYDVGWTLVGPLFN